MGFIVVKKEFIICASEFEFDSSNDAKLNVLDKFDRLNLS